MDAVITPEALAEVTALSVLRRAAPRWGFLIGHKRGPRFFVERVFPAGAGLTLPSAAELDALDRLFGRAVIGVFAVRPSAAFRASAAGPYFYGRLFLDVRPMRRTPVLKPYVVGFEGKFILVPVGLEPGPKGAAHG